MATLDGVTAHYGNYNYTRFGWPSGPQNIVPYSCPCPNPACGVTFPQGMRAEAKPWFDHVLNLLRVKYGYHPRNVDGSIGRATNIRNMQNWCQSTREIRSGGVSSFHTAGIAIDLNSGENPYSPSGRAGPHTIPDAIGPEVRAIGGEWGGDWSSPKDYMHLEIHLSLPDLLIVNSRLPIIGDKPAPEPVKVQEDTMVSLDDGSTLFLIGADGKIYQNTRTAGWSGWKQNGIPGTYSKSLSGTHGKDGVYRLVAVGTDGQVYETVYVPGEKGWRYPSPLGGKSI